jgi:hypothetical protein
MTSFSAMSDVALVPSSDQYSNGDRPVPGRFIETFSEVNTSPVLIAFKATKLRRAIFLF